MPESNFNFSIGIPDPNANHSDKKIAKPKKFPITYKDLCNWIDLEYEKEIAEALKNKAKRVPDGALGNFKKNITKHISNIKKDTNLKKEK